MADITTINANDRVKDSRAVINTNFDNLNTDLAQVEDNVVTLGETSPTADQKAAMSGSGGTPSDSNRYILQNSPLVGNVTLTAGETLNGATTPVPVYQNKTDNEFYACDANDSARYKFIGFATSTAINGDPINVQFSGVVGGFTGLLEGEKYYVQDTVGTIGTTPGTQSILVGVAISQTQLVVQKGTHRASGTGAVTDSSGSEVVACGFRPSKINLFASSSSSSYISTMSASWSNNVIRGIGCLYNEGSGSDIQEQPRLYSGSNSDYQTFAITSVTDTGFTITWTETGSFTSGVLHWEAEGEL